MKKILRAAVSGLVLSAAAGSGYAAISHVDLSPYANFNTNTYFSTNLGSGLVSGNASAAAANMSFSVLSSTSRYNVWEGATAGAQVDIHTNIYNASTVYTLMNTFWGFNGAAAATVEFKGTGGANQLFTLYGRVDIRDYNKGANQPLSGTMTQNWWNNTYYYDMQTFALNSSFQNQTLTDIIITAASGSGSGRSMPFLTGVNVEYAASVVPEADSWSLMLAGLACVGWAGRRKRAATGARISAKR